MTLARWTDFSTPRYLCLSHSVWRRRAFTTFANPGGHVRRCYAGSKTAEGILFVFDIVQSVYRVSRISRRRPAVVTRHLESPSTSELTCQMTGVSFGFLDSFRHAEYLVQLLILGLSLPIAAGSGHDFSCCKRKRDDVLAEEQGFEPWRRSYRPGGFQDRSLRPAWVLLHVCVEFIVSFFEANVNGFLRNFEAFAFVFLWKRCCGLGFAPRNLVSFGLEESALPAAVRGFSPPAMHCSFGRAHIPSTICLLFTRRSKPLTRFTSLPMLRG